MTANVKLKREINRKGRGTYLVKTTMTANVKLKLNWSDVEHEHENERY